MRLSWVRPLRRHLLGMQLAPADLVVEAVPSNSGATTAPAMTAPPSFTMAQLHVTCGPGERIVYLLEQSSGGRLPLEWADLPWPTEPTSLQSAQEQARAFADSLSDHTVFKDEHMELDFLRIRRQLRGADGNVIAEDISTAYPIPVVQYKARFSQRDLGTVPAEVLEYATTDGGGQPGIWLLLSPSNRRAMFDPRLAVEELRARIGQPDPQTGLVPEALLAQRQLADGTFATIASYGLPEVFPNDLAWPPESTGRK